MPMRFRQASVADRRFFPKQHRLRRRIHLMADGLSYDDGYPSSSDVTAPVPNIVSTSRAIISHVSGYASTDIVWTSNEDFQAYQLRVVANSSDDVTTGTLIEQNQSPTAGGTANTQYTSTITDAELVAASPADGSKMIKLFVQDLAGNWSI